MARLAVVLTGCGRLDGTDIHEAALIFVAVEQEGHTAVCLAPDGDQQVVADHAAADLDVPGPARNILAESARLAQGTVRPLQEVPARMLDGVIIPGGAGSFRALCSPGSLGMGGGELREDVRAFLQAVLDQGGRIGAVGLASVVLDRLRRRDLRQDPAGLPPDRLTVDADCATAYCSGMLGSRSLVEAGAGIRELVAWVAGAGAKERQ